LAAKSKNPFVPRPKRWYFASSSASSTVVPLVVDEQDAFTECPRQLIEEVDLRDEPMSTNDHFTVSISSLSNGLNDDRRSLPRHTLTVTSAGRLSIDSQHGRRTFALGDWDDRELKMLPHIETASLANAG
jgi:hypothetical protein